MLNSILKSVNQVQTSLGDLLIDILLTKIVNEPYVPGSAQLKTETTSLLKGFFDTITQDEADGTLIKVSDLKIYIFPTETIFPDVNDLVVIQSLTYRIVAIKPVYAGNRAIIFTVYVRPGG